MLFALATLTIAACLVSGLILVAGFRQRPNDRREQAARSFLPNAAQEDTPACIPPGLTDATAELQALLPGFAPLVARQLVDMDVAIQPGLLTRIDAGVIREVLTAVLADTLHRAAYGRVLVSAMRLEPWIHIAITDDVPQDSDARGADLRDWADRLALHGGGLSVDARTEGVTVTLRLPSAAQTASAPRQQVAAQTQHHPLPQALD